MVIIMETKNFSFLCAVEIFLLTQDKKEVLLIHRDRSREVMPDYYSGIGGKMDSSILETALETAFREIKEETGYNKNEIQNMKLKAILFVEDKFGKWIVFQYVGFITKKKFKKYFKIEEGRLEWVNINNINNIKLIDDLQNGVLQKILYTRKFLYTKAIFNNDDKLIEINIAEN